MTPNEQVLLQGCNSLLVRPEPLLIKNKKYKITNKSLAMFVPPG
jgi:hypothetical protein